jgi:hypothetical protein
MQNALMRKDFFHGAGGGEPAIRHWWAEGIRRAGQSLP